MTKDQQQMKRFLEEQVEWCKSQDTILEKIENKLYDMKALAEYACDHSLSLAEINLINTQLNTLKQEVNSLEQQLYSIVH